MTNIDGGTEKESHGEEDGHWNITFSDLVRNKYG
jgi:hypothetical protein